MGILSHASRDLNYMTSKDIPFSGWKSFLFCTKSINFKSFSRTCFKKVYLILFNLFIRRWRGTILFMQKFGPWRDSSSDGEVCKRALLEQQINHSLEYYLNTYNCGFLKCQMFLPFRLMIVVCSIWFLLIFLTEKNVFVSGDQTWGDSNDSFLGFCC